MPGNCHTSIAKFWQMFTYSYLHYYKTTEMRSSTKNVQCPSWPAPAYPGRPAGTGRQSSQRAEHTRDRGGRRILLRLPSVYCLLPGQRAHLTCNGTTQCSPERPKRAAMSVAAVVCSTQAVARARLRSSIQARLRWRAPSFDQIQDE